ncbi:MAG TPA: FmdB family zinc ribbon protein [Candidatus Limnocylindria bacterium]
MPTYDYQCRSCGHTIEVIHPMSEDGPTTCEVCGGELRRILHPAGIIFKGTGFYKTDSRSASSASVPAGAKGTSSDSAPAKPAEGGAAKGGETKTAPNPKPGGTQPAAD